jgi:hypothetical protein
MRGEQRGRILSGNFWRFREVLRVRPDLLARNTLALPRQLTPVLFDQLIQTELLEPIADLPEGKPQFPGSLGLDPMVALQGSQYLPLF